MKKNLLFILAFLSISCFVCSCDKNDDPVPSPYPVETTGVYVLNSGKMSNNNASLTLYDPVSTVVYPDVFAGANGKKLGDTGNDMIIYGSKMYIGVTNSSIVFVTDLNGKLIKEITVKGSEANLSPRHFDAANGKVYVSFMEGYAGEIDTTTLNIKTIAVGAMPEGIAYVNNKVYVANSDGYNYPYGTSVSVINASTFTVSKQIDVANNPQTFHKAEDGSLYLISWGDYGSVPASLQKINTITDAVTTVEGVVPTNMAIGRNNKAYILSSVYDANWNQTIKYYVYNTSTDKLEGEFTTSDDVPHGYCLFTDNLSGLVYIGTSDYKSNGDMYIFDEKGEFVKKFDTMGINPIKVAFVTK